MSINTSHLPVVLCLKVAAVVFLAQIVPAQALDYSVRLSATARQSDNAFRDDNNKTSEQQNEYGGSLSLTEDQPNYLVDINYRSNRSDFAKDSQESRTITSGTSNLRLGRSQGLFLVEASHSRERTLIDNAGPDILENNDERTVVHASPIFNFAFSKVDRLSLSGNFDAISYSEQPLRDSERQGATLSWMHRLSRISQFGLNLQQVDVEYTEIDNSEYTYQNAYFIYSAALRNFQYRFNLGYNQSDQSGEVFGGPSYNINLTYAKENFSYGAEFVSLITDTSAGNMNRVSLPANENDPAQNSQTPDGSSLLVDQYKLLTNEIFFRTSSLCLYCEFNLGVGVSKEDYRLYTEENNTENFGSATLSYDLTKRSDLSYFYRLSDIDYEQGNRSSKQQEHRLEWRWTTQLGLSVALLGEKRNYQSDGTQGNYKENFYGLRLDYVLGRSFN